MESIDECFRNVIKDKCPDRVNDFHTSYTYMFMPVQCDM